MLNALSIQKFTKASLLVLASSFLMTSSVFATNGYFSHGVGTKNKAQAGAGIAAPDEAIAIANNPASALLVDDSLDIGIAIFNPRRSYTSSASQAQGNGGAFTIGPNSLDSGREYFFIPNIAKNWKLTDHSAIGVAFYGRGGMNTRWNGGTASFDPDGPGPAPVSTLPGTFGAGTAGVDLAQAFLDVSYAYQVNEQFTVGIGASIVSQFFEATGVNTFAGFTQSFNDGFFANGQPGAVNNLSNNGHDSSFGIGAKLGAHWQASPSVAIAGSYQTKINTSEFDDYSDLFAESGGFDIPANSKLGISIATNPKTKIHFDVEHTAYSDVDSVGNPFSNIFTCPAANPQSTSTAGCLGGPNGAGFGWDDVTTFKLGGEYALSDVWTLRGGYSYGEQPIADSEVLFNILAPGVIENHITFGATKTLANDNEWSVAFLYAPSTSVSGTNPFDPTQTIELEMDQFELEFSYSWK